MNLAGYLLHPMDCPHCGRLLYSRQHAKCGFCGVTLPAECLLSEEEIAVLKAEQHAIAERQAREKEKEAAKRAHGDTTSPSMPPPM